MSSTLETRSSSHHFWAVVPAAGVGRRMGSDVPKQYLQLNGKPVIQHTLQRLASHSMIEGIVVAISEGDEYWEELALSVDKPVIRVNGGEERCHSVLNALDALAQQADSHDWVLVHDAARPCLRHEDLDCLISSADESDQGALLAVPVRDTMKRSDDAGRVSETVERNHLWHALTPQMFRLGLLRKALQQALDNRQLVTDESSAMELAGFSPRLVEGHADNIKITRPEDLMLAEFYLQQQESSSCV